MSTFQNILLPIAFSSHEERAVEVALSLARDGGSKVTLVHVFQTGVDYVVGASGPWSLEAAKSEAKKSLDAALVALQAKYPHITAVLASGSPSDCILEAAANHHCDLVVMGTHGRRGLSRAFQGSVAETVVRSASIPVLTVGQLADPRARAAAERG